VDAYNEAGHRALMQLFAEEGEPARVKEVYCNLQNRLSEDLEVAPDVATTELYRSLLPTGAQRVIPHPVPAEVLRLPADIARPNGEGASEDAARIFGLGRRTGVPRITIMPPSALGAHDFHHQLAGSLIEDVTLGLCRLKTLSVVAPHTAWELSQTGKKALFRAFRIDYAVETQLIDDGGGSVLSVKLLTAPDRSIVWTEQFAFSRDLNARNYRDLSARIVMWLNEGVERTELTLYEREPDPTAYHLYLLGKRHLRSTDLPSIRRARRVFRSALSNCSDFVPAISGLARTFQLEWLLLARNDKELLAEAEVLARRALEIDVDDARGHRELGVCHLYAGRFDESLYALDQAERRNPQFADLIMDHSDALLHAGQASLALHKMKQAIEMNPLCPDTYWWAAGGANYQLHRYQDAVECLSRMRDQSPVYRLLAASWAKLGERERAREYVRRTREIHPDFSVGGLLSLIPFRDPSYAKHYEDGLREAGFS
jgi:tetratricopeptide (TPR) repeat protein